MAKYSDTLNRRFQALADPTRRTVVERLAMGSASVSELAQGTQMALPSFVQHLKILEESGLVQSVKTGRVRVYTLQTHAFEPVLEWLKVPSQLWACRLDQLDHYLQTMKEVPDGNHPKP